MKKYAIATLLAFIKILNVQAQISRSLPIIDMHLHALRANDQGPAPIKIGAPFKNFGYNDPKIPYAETFMKILKTGEWSDNNITSPLTDDSIQIKTIKILKKYNIYAVTSGDVDMVRKWHDTEPTRIINGIRWNFSEATQNGVNLDSLTKLFKSGDFKVFGEVTIQYEGYSPSDSAFEPYLSMAETLDIPVGIHIGPGPPGVVYLGASKYRASLHSATVLEEALIKHPKLRVYAMHAGWPMLDDILATLYAHPQLYVDLGLISYAIPEKEFYFYLQRLVNAGFEKRVMFGSDNMVWPESIKIAVDRVNRASFLTPEQKRDILFNNAARFLRLTDAQIRNMYQE